MCARIVSHTLSTLESSFFYHSLKHTTENTVELLVFVSLVTRYVSSAYLLCVYGLTLNRFWSTVVTSSSFLGFCSFCHGILATCSILHSLHFVCVAFFYCGFCFPRPHFLVLFLLFKLNGLVSCWCCFVNIIIFIRMFGFSFLLTSKYNQV